MDGGSQAPIRVRASAEGIASSLDRIRHEPLDGIGAEEVATVVARILDPERNRSGILEVAAFSSSI